MPDNEGAGEVDAVLAEGLDDITTRVVDVAERLRVFAADPFNRTEELDVEDRAAVEALLPDLRNILVQLSGAVIDVERRLAGSRQAVFGLRANKVRTSSRHRVWSRRANSLREHRVQAEAVEWQLWRLSELLKTLSAQQKVLNHTFNQAEEMVDALLPTISGSNLHERAEVQRALMRHAIYQDFLDATREHLDQLNQAARKLKLMAQELILLRAALQEAGSPVLPDHVLFRTWLERAHRGMLSASSLARRRVSLR